MSLTDSKFEMKLEIAQASENQAILDFFKGFPLKGLLELKLDRRGDFFGPYSVESDRFRTYLLKDAETNIQGMASFIVKEVLLEGKVTTVAFGRDLRISTNRRAITEWADHFVPTLKEMKRDHGVEHFFAALNMAETPALNAFVRPRNLKRVLPRYYNYRNFNLVTVHGRFPWAENPVPHLQMRSGSSSSADALIYYLTQKNRTRNLATYWDGYSFFKQLQRWRGLRLEDFLVAFDAKNNIVGCCAPWSSEGIEEYIPLEYSMKAHNFRQFLKFGKLLGWTRPLTKPSYRLQFEEHMQYQYLTHLFADNEDIFEAMLWSAFDRARSKDFLVYSQFRNDVIYRKPLNWVATRIPHGLYSMLPPDQSPPGFLSPSNETPVAFEPFFV